MAVSRDSRDDFCMIFCRYVYARDLRLLSHNPFEFLLVRLSRISPLMTQESAPSPLRHKAPNSLQRVAAALGRVVELGFSADCTVPDEDAAPPALAACLAGADLCSSQCAYHGHGRREGGNAGGQPRYPGDRSHGGRGKPVPSRALIGALKSCFFQSFVPPPLPPPPAGATF